MPFQTSPVLFGNDYLLNLSVAVQAHLCAVKADRLNDMLRNVGLAVLSSRHTVETRKDCEEPLAHAAQASMAEAWDREMRERAANPSLPRAIGIDSGWDHGRDGANAVMPVMSCGSGRVLCLDIVRRSDKAVKSSVSMETHNCANVLANPLIQLGEFDTVVMDGARPLQKRVEKAGLRVAGDAWHGNKNRSKQFNNFVETFTAKAAASPRERELAAMQKPATPEQPQKKVARLGKPASPDPPPSLDAMREQLLEAGEHVPDGDDTKSLKELRAQFDALRLVAHARAQLADLGHEPPPRAAVADLAARASAAALVRVQTGAAMIGDLPPLDPDDIKGMKVAELKLQLEARNLDVGGKKAELASRLTDAIVAVEEAGEEAGEEEDVDCVEMQPLGNSAAAAAVAAEAKRKAEACGVAVEWYLLQCPICNARLQCWLRYVRTELVCNCCGGHFTARNEHLAATPRPPVLLPIIQSQKRPGGSCYFRAFLSRTMKAAPMQDRQSCLRNAMMNWAAHKDEPGVAEAREARREADREERLRLRVQCVVHTPSVASSSVSRTQSMLQMVTATTPLPPPAFLPIEQRAKKRKRDRVEDASQVNRICKVTRA